MSDPVSSCEARSVVFVVLEGDPEMAAVEDDIRQDLAKIGIKSKHALSTKPRTGKLR